MEKSTFLIAVCAIKKVQCTSYIQIIDLHAHMHRILKKCICEAHSQKTSRLSYLVLLIFKRTFIVMTEYE